MMTVQELVDTLFTDKSGFEYAISEFLHRMKYSKNTEARQKAIQIEPVWPTGFPEIKKAFIAASVQKLSKDYGLVTPEWVFKKAYFNLEHPWFAMNAQGDLRIILLQESPNEFRSRNLFVDAQVNTVV